MFNISVDPNTQYVAYIVRERNSRRFLNRKAYSGRITGIWTKAEQSEVFDTRVQAQSCASGINYNRPSGYSSYFAEVRPIVMQRIRPLNTQK